MRWIEATPMQRAAIIARAEREKEEKINRPEYQAELRACIAILCGCIVEKQELAIADPSIARRLNRQIGDLEEELEFYRSELREPKKVNHELASKSR